MKKILLIDDDLSVQQTISDFFHLRSSYKVYTAEDGEIALDQISHDPPDLILLDILLPRINGLAFLSDLRKSKKAKNIPVICMSGQMVDDEDKKVGYDLGAIDYLLKPLDLES